MSHTYIILKVINGDDAHADNYDEEEDDEHGVYVLCSLPLVASRSPSEFPLTAQTDLSHSSPGHGDDHDDAALDGNDLDSDALDNLDEYLSTEQMRRACLFSPVSDACSDL